MMAGIRGKNTRPEIFVRKMLHGAGLRFRLHVGELPGKPDIVLPRWRAVIQVQGCFWHGHDCHLFRVPATRPEFWATKIAGNRARDGAARAELAALGWRQLSVWECSLKGRERLPAEVVLQQILAWLQRDVMVGDVRGTD